MVIPTPHRISSDAFTAVPDDLVKLLRERLEETADEVEREVRVSVPEYARHGDNYVKNLRAGVVQALTLFVDLVADPLRDWESISATYYEIGAARPWRAAAWTPCSPHCGSADGSPGV